MKDIIEQATHELNIKVNLYPYDNIVDDTWSNQYTSYRINQPIKSRFYSFIKPYLIFNTKYNSYFKKE